MTNGRRKSSGKSCSSFHFLLLRMSGMVVNMFYPMFSGIPNARFVYEYIVFLICSGYVQSIFEKYSPEYQSHPI